MTGSRVILLSIPKPMRESLSGLDEKQIRLILNSYLITGTIPMAVVDKMRLMNLARPPPSEQGARQEDQPNGSRL